MDISNRALAMFLLAAIVVSLAGTITSLNRLGSITTTGYASSQGTVQLNVAQQLSITTEDSPSVNFGDCTPTPPIPLIINSENLSNTSVTCSSYATIQNISVRNDGNIEANVSLNFSDVGEASYGGFLTSTSSVSEIAYKITNAARDAGSSGGCAAGNFTASYTNATNASTVLFPGCWNLSYGVDTTNSFVTDFQIIVPADADIQNPTVTITYQAEAN